MVEVARSRRVAVELPEAVVGRPAGVEVEEEERRAFYPAFSRWRRAAGACPSGAEAPARHRPSRLAGAECLAPVELPGRWLSSPCEPRQDPHHRGPTI